MNNLDLLKRAREGDELSFSEFFNNNIRLVYSLLKRYDIKKSEYEDVLQEAKYGLCLAMKRYDFKYEVNFSTYAVPIILGEIRRYFRENSALKVTRSIKELSYKINELLSSYPSLSIDDLARKFNESKERIVEAISLKSYIMSLDESIYDNDDEMMINNVANDDLSLIDLTSLNLAFEKLDKKEKLILELRYYGGYSQIEVSKRLNISQVQVSRLESKILNKLRELI